MDVLKLLEDVKNDKVSLEEAAKELKQLPYEDLGFAKLDHHRQIRSGFGEVVFCSGKSDEHLLKIYETFYKTDTEVLGTRASEHQYELVKAVIPEVTYDPLSRILKIEKPGKERIGRVAVCTAGTADIAVAEEAAQVAEYFGTNVDRFYDVGVAGIHRLFAKLEEIRKANCIIAVAGMEGALGGVLAGLVEVPVIAVPTSIGYGANFGGLSALLTMLNSCSNGITVVNIDEWPKLSFNGKTGAFNTVTEAGGTATAGDVVKSLNIKINNAAAGDGSDGLVKSFPDTGVDIDFSNLTNYASNGACSVKPNRGDTSGKDAGNMAGKLNGFSIQTDGKIYGVYSNGDKKLLGQIAVATFENPSGLEAVGNSMYAASLNSGDFDGIGIDISEVGKFSIGALEMSDVDLSTEFTNMITTQRGFQANSRVITTSDTMLEELVNLKR